MSLDISISQFKIHKILKKNRINVFSFERFSSGQINEVYNINDKYVLKIEGVHPHRKDILKYQLKIYPQLEKISAKIPRILDTGLIESRKFVLMEKLRGNNVVYDYLKFTRKEKESIWKQVVDELKRWHSITFEKYYSADSYKEKDEGLNPISKKIIDFKKIDEVKLDTFTRNNIKLVRNFYLSTIKLLRESEISVLIHGDIHLENIFHHNGTLTGLIDFDCIAQAPKKHDLWRIIDMAYFPHHYVEEKLKNDYIGYDMKWELSVLRKHYPELFEDKYIVAKYNLYAIDYIIDTIEGCQSGRWSENVLKEVNKKIIDLYKNNWTTKILNN